MNCGCRIEYAETIADGDPEVDRIHYCPLHAAAEKLLDACGAALLTLNINRKRITCEPLEKKLRAAIAQAEGKS